MVKRCRFNLLQGYADLQHHHGHCVDNPLYKPRSLNQFMWQTHGHLESVCATYVMVIDGSKRSTVTSL